MVRKLSVIVALLCVAACSSDGGAGGGLPPDPVEEQMVDKNLPCNFNNLELPKHLDQVDPNEPIQQGLYEFKKAEYLFERDNDQMIYSYESNGERILSKTFTNCKEAEVKNVKATLGERGFYYGIVSPQKVISYAGKFKQNDKGIIHFRKRFDGNYVDREILKRPRPTQASDNERNRLLVSSHRFNVPGGILLIHRSLERPNATHVITYQLFTRVRSISQSEYEEAGPENGSNEPDPVVVTPPHLPTVEECLAKHDIDLGEVPVQHVEFKENIMIVQGENTYWKRNCDQLIAVGGPVYYHQSSAWIDSGIPICVEGVSNPDVRTKTAGVIGVSTKWTKIHLELRNQVPRDFSIGAVSVGFNNIHDVKYDDQNGEDVFIHRMHGVFDGVLGNSSTCDMKEQIHSGEDEDEIKFEKYMIDKFNLRQGSKKIVSYTELKNKIVESE